ncbi:hypothetical protein SPFM10_00154 [Salmonella phage SPFM10]|nr:hypothetical protein SPFM10_00154 [Salmonella phage SPFM10]
MILIANTEYYEIAFLGDEYCVRTQGRELTDDYQTADMLLQSFVPLRAISLQGLTIHEIQKYLLEGGTSTMTYHLNCY